MAFVNSIDALNCYLVGGAVRDTLLGRKVIEQDYLVVGSSVAEMLSLGFSQVGKDFPVFLHPKTKAEYALARTEKKAGVGYTGFICNADKSVSLEDDLLRRDLTVNAIAQDKNGQLFDPFNGQQDLQDKVLRHVSHAFVEDPLRVLRVARFAARYHQYGFTVAPETIALMSDIANSGELASLSAERVFKEIERSLGEENPEVFFQVLRQCHALAALLPEIDRLWGVPNPAKWHPEICTGVHTMMVLKQAVKKSDSIAVRFAALCHDLGKGITPEQHWPKHHGHETTGLPLIKALAKRLKVPNQYQQLALKVCEFHLHCHKAFELKATTILKVFNAIDVWRKPEDFADFLLCCKADIQGRLGFENRDYPQTDFLALLAENTRAVSAQAFIEQGLTGKDIKNAMDKEKIRVIEKVKSEYLAAQ
ncbi:MAG: multifunctional CCA addition/repair protein [Thalassotalea sp.]